MHERKRELECEVIKMCEREEKRREMILYTIESIDNCVNIVRSLQ